MKAKTRRAIVALCDMVDKHYEDSFTYGQLVDRVEMASASLDVRNLSNRESRRPVQRNTPASNNTVLNRQNEVKRAKYHPEYKDWLIENIREKIKDNLKSNRDWNTINDD